MIDGIYSTIADLKKVRKFFPTYKETFDEMIRKLEEIKKLELKQIEELIKDGEVPRGVWKILNDFFKEPNSIRIYFIDCGKTVDSNLYVLEDLGYIMPTDKGYRFNKNMIGRVAEIVKRYKPDSYALSESNIDSLRKLNKL